jgi:hypothetical protein
MTKPIRIKRSRSAGWKKPPNTVNCTRPGRYGNPFTVEKYGLENSLMLFRKLLTECVSPYDLPFDAQEDAFNSEIIKAYDKSNAPSILDMVKGDLRGKDLMCFCSLSEKCHVDILLELSNKIG